MTQYARPNSDGGDAEWVNHNNNTGLGAVMRLENNNEEFNPKRMIENEARNSSTTRLSSNLNRSFNSN